jgi:hypothetical protein
MEDKTLFPENRVSVVLGPVCREILHVFRSILSASEFIPVHVYISTRVTRCCMVLRQEGRSEITSQKLRYGYQNEI